jgi:hypothetical protein
VPKCWAKKILVDKADAGNSLNQLHIRPEINAFCMSLNLHLKESPRRG